jgi:hypothetical protein
VTDAPDERTTPVARRAAPGADPEEDAEATVASTRGTSEGGTATQPSEPGDPAAPGPRRSGAGATHTRVDGQGDADPDEGSTIVARRESRRRAARADAAAPADVALPTASDDATVVVASSGRRLSSTPAGGVPAQAGRLAQPPATLAAPYVPRAPQSVVVPRAGAPERPVQEAVDTAALEQAARRRSRRRAGAVVVISVGVVLIATTAIVILSTL